MDVQPHYDLLIKENNDPFRDPPALRRYIESWDRQVSCKTSQSRRKPRCFQR